MRSVIVHLAGGLGNQLFQYANASALAHRHCAQVLLDKSFFSQYKLHSYSLHHFNISAKSAGLLQTSLRKGPIGRIHDSVVSEGNRWHIKEKHFHFVPETLKLKPPVYLEGYWQSEKYFKDFEDAIRSELTVVTPPSEDNARMLQSIAATPSVSLHIRRGDYASNKHTESVHGLIPLDFYYSAARQVAKSVKDAVVFVFSDDPEWARANLKLELETRFVDINGPDRNYEDLRLMSSCKHQIIANSTFSWWGAWLNPNPDKVVIAPDPWFRSKELNAKDLVPESWIKLAFQTPIL